MMTELWLLVFPGKFQKSKSAGCSYLNWRYCYNIAPFSHVMSRIWELTQPILEFVSCRWKPTDFRATERVDASRVYASSDQKKFQDFRILSRWNFTTGSTVWSFCKIEQVPLEQIFGVLSCCDDCESFWIILLPFKVSFTNHGVVSTVYNPQNNVMKSPNRWRDADLQKFNFGFIWRCPLPIEVPYQVLTTGEDACLRFWDLRLAARLILFRCPTLPNGDRKWKSTKKPTGKPWNSDEQAAFQLFAQPVRWTSSLGQMLINLTMLWWWCSWQKVSWNLLGCNLSFGCQFARINLLNIDFANFLISLICCVSMSPEPPLKEHPFETSAAQTGHVNMRTWMCSHLSQV